MEYSTFVPDPLLQQFVDCYWIVEGKDQSVQKIIPDGCPELIFHFCDPYEFSCEGTSSRLQSLSIAAGQLAKPIYLQPTGVSGVLGIKFKPCGMWSLLGGAMDVLTNQTYGIDEVFGKHVSTLAEQIRDTVTNDQRISIAETFLLSKLRAVKNNGVLNHVVDDIVKNRGQLSIQKLSKHYKMSARKMERMFQQQVGVSPKLYSRLMRFKHVYNLLGQSTLTKAEATYLSGYFDQAHFNKEFKEFTGENPELHFAQDHGFSNFFLNR